MFEPKDIFQVLTLNRTRGSYLETLLEFQLGRQPTKKEIEQYKDESEKRRIAHEKWLETQLLRVRLNREERIYRILQKRYNVPEWLIRALVEELSDF